MVAAPEIAWEAFVLAISLFSRRAVCPGCGWQGERELRSSVSLQGPKSWPRPADRPPGSSATCPLLEPVRRGTNV